jgi:hypothetical protein
LQVRRPARDVYVEEADLISNIDRNRLGQNFVNVHDWTDYARDTEIIWDPYNEEYYTQLP